MKATVKSVRVHVLGRTQNLGNYNSEQCQLGMEIDFPEGATSDEARQALRGAISLLNEEVERELVRRAHLIQVGNDKVFNEYFQIDANTVTEGYAPHED